MEVRTIAQTNEWRPQHPLGPPLRFSPGMTNAWKTQREYVRKNRIDRSVGGTRSTGTWLLPYEA